jgi:hypothetical protein
VRVGLVNRAHFSEFLEFVYQNFSLTQDSRTLRRLVW